MLKDRKFIVFGIDHYNPLGIIRSLGREGIKPDFICIRGKAPIASSSKYINKLWTVDDYHKGCEVLLNEYSNYDKNCLPIVITTDDEQVEEMDLHYSKYVNKFIIFNAGENGRITKYIDKYNILQLAKKHGLKTLETYTVKKGVVLDHLPYPIITKSISPNVGGWKSDVFICENEEELRLAYEKIQAPQVILQHYIDKKNECALQGFSINRGRDLFIGVAMDWKYLIKGYYSPYHNVYSFNQPDIQEKLNSMLEEIGYEGIFEIEFLIDKDGTYYFSEINFRNSPWSYAATFAGMNIPYLWAQSMIDGKIPRGAYKAISEPFDSMCESVDYQKRVVERGYSQSKWIEDFKNAKCKYFYDKDDPAPFFVMIENNDKLR